MFTWNDMNEPSVFNGPEVTMPKVIMNEPSVFNGLEVTMPKVIMNEPSVFKGLEVTMPGSEKDQIKNVA